MQEVDQDRVVRHSELNCLLNSQTQGELHFKYEFKESRINMKCNSKKFKSKYSYKILCAYTQHMEYFQKH